MVQAAYVPPPFLYTETYRYERIGLPPWATKFIEMVLMLTADHGPAVSGYVAPDDKSSYWS